MIKIMILTCASFSTGWLNDCQTTTYIHTLYAYMYTVYANCCQHFSNKMLFEAQKKGVGVFSWRPCSSLLKGWDSCFPTQLLGISLHDYVDCRHFWSWIHASCIHIYIYMMPYIYIYLAPIWPLFLKVNPPIHKALDSNQNKGPHLGSRYI